MKDQEKLFKTKNLHIATHLHAQDLVEFLGVFDDDLTHSKVFAFRPYLKALELAQGYHDGDELPTKEVFKSYNFIKDVLFKGGSK